MYQQWLMYSKTEAPAVDGKEWRTYYLESLKKLEELENNIANTTKAHTVHTQEDKQKAVVAKIQ